MKREERYMIISAGKFQLLKIQTCNFRASDITQTFLYLNSVIQQSCIQDFENVGQLAHDFQKYGPTTKNVGQQNLSQELLIFTHQFYRFPVILLIHGSTALTGTERYQKGFFFTY